LGTLKATGKFSTSSECLHEESYRCNCMKVLTRLVTAAADPRQFPPATAPEIAFLGRSNVGKSSLINALVGAKIARTSNTPGRTQTINFFQVRRPGKPSPDFIFTDLPGYGYARVPKELTSKWGQFINPYLEKRQSLVLCLALVDVSVPPQHLDVQLLDWLRHARRNFIVIATKADRISNNQLRAALHKLSEQLQVPMDRLIPFSARARIGSDEVWRAIRSAAGLEDSANQPLEATGT
jgi:GTP-binding protein